MDAAKKIRTALDALNLTIRDAAEEGVRIQELREIELTAESSNCKTVIYEAVIIKFV